MNKAKILKSEFTKEWGSGFNKVFYHNVWLDGQGDKPYNIGAKEQNPSFLSAGQVLEYEVTDEAKRKIKRAQAKFQNQTKSSSGGGSSYKKQAAPPPNPDSPSLIRHLDNFDESNLIFLDIETVRAAKTLTEEHPLYEAWAYKNRYNNELERKTGEPVTLEEYWNEKAALYAVFAKAVVIVVGRIHGDVLKTKRYAVSKTNKWDEKLILAEFNNDINTILDKNPNTVFAGWANKTFDQPFLSKRMYVNRIKPNLLLDTAHLKPWEIASVDLKELWQGTAYYPDSLLAAAAALGLPSPKEKMDGAQVGEAYYAGKIDEIAEYCELDVLTEANIYRILAGKPTVSIK